MNRYVGMVLGLAVVAGLTVSPVAAAGPVDGEVTAMYWLSDTEFDDGGMTVSADSEDVGFRGELWFVKKVGASLSMFSADVDGGGSIDYNSLDVKWRVLSPTENNFLAVGAGWQEIDAGGGDDATGFRVVVEGRVALVGIVYFYGRGAYVPSLDVDGDDGDMTELEAGVMVKPAPFVQLFAGYRSNDTSLDSGFDLTTDGFVVGAGVNF